MYIKTTVANLINECKVTWLTNRVQSTENKIKLAY